jgi:hypothetical protein
MVADINVLLRVDEKSGIIIEVMIEMSLSYSSPKSQFHSFTQIPRLTGVQEE